MHKDEEITFAEFRDEILNDYKLACYSRRASVLGRKETLSGRAKFGIFGDGKEIAQIAMAKVFKPGDFRAGYYRDQTFMFATGMSTIEEFFAQLYAHADINFDPSSGGRAMNCHYATRSLDQKGQWKNLTQIKNSSADTSPTAGQMPRLLGLAQASKIYRKNKNLSHSEKFSLNGNEIAFGTIGDSSTSEGVFFETMNAAGIMQVPIIMSVWDDGYGISVSKKHQTLKESISELLSGFRRDHKKPGWEIINVKGWDYPSLCQVYVKAADLCRKEHVPVLIHVEELTQPQGHSTSGSHERYKSPERLKWEKDHDCIAKMRLWVLNNLIATEEDLKAIENEAEETVKKIQSKAWENFKAPIKEELENVLSLMEKFAPLADNTTLQNCIEKLKTIKNPFRKDFISLVRKVLYSTVAQSDIPERIALVVWYKQATEANNERYGSYLFSDTEQSVNTVSVKDPVYDENADEVDGREILRACFKENFTRDDTLLAFGEDVGLIGDVNQAFAGLQKMFGKDRVFDTGIRESTIMGQGIGLAMRGLRPIAELQYLDYIYFALQPLADDLSCLSYRTVRGQKAPLIVRTRGHRLEGIWHSGSPMSLLLGSLRGMHICVPRNMTQAAGMYNVLFRSDEPALVIECLNGYRIKEKMPSNVGDFTVPLGIPEILTEGSDITIVTYGPCVQIAKDAALILKEHGISIELIDVQTLLPFDHNHMIAQSLKKTNKILFLDEDIPSGATAFMMQKVLEEQKGYYYLDSPAVTLSAKEHRPPYGSDGNYFSKPNTEDVFETVYNIMHEANPGSFPALF